MRAPEPGSTRHRAEKPSALPHHRVPQSPRRREPLGWGPAAPQEFCSPLPAVAGPAGLSDGVEHGTEKGVAQDKAPVGVSALPCPVLKLPPNCRAAITANVRPENTRSSSAVRCSGHTFHRLASSELRATGHGQHQAALVRAPNTEHGTPASSICSGWVCHSASTTKPRYFCKRFYMNILTTVGKAILELLVY